MPFNLYIEGYGTATFSTAAERDSYAAFKDLFLATGGASPHTNMDSVIREYNLYIPQTFENPLLNAGMDHVGIPRATLKAYTTPQWDLMFPQGTTPTIDIKNRVVNKYSPGFNKENYYKARFSTPCGGTCEVLLVSNQTVSILDMLTLTSTTLMVLPGSAGHIAKFADKFYAVFSNVIQEFQIDYNNCSASHVRSINNTTVPWNGAPTGLCSKNASTLIGGGNNINGGGMWGGWIVEYDISGMNTVINPLFDMSIWSFYPTGYDIGRISGAIIYIPALDQIVTSEIWQGLNNQSVPHLAVRDRATGNLICYCSTTPGGAANLHQVWGLFCHDGNIYGVNFDTPTGGIFAITYNPATLTISYNPTYIMNDTGGGAASDPTCCGPTVVNPPSTVAGYCCTDSAGNSVGVCSNATANCGGNNSDGRIATVLECLTNCPIGSGTWDLEVTDSNGIVINSVVGMSAAGFFQVSTQLNGLDPGTYIVRYYNLILDGISHGDINVSCIVLGDTPWTCATNVSCCAVMWNCTNCHCHSVMGAGQYNTEADCIANCCIPSIPAEDDCSDFDICIDCDNTLIH